MPYKSLLRQLTVICLLFLPLTVQQRAVAAAELILPQSEQTSGGDITFGWTSDPQAIGYRLLIVDKDGNSYGSVQLYDRNITAIVVRDIPAGKLFKAELITVYRDSESLAQYTDWHTRIFNSSAARIIEPLSDTLVGSTVTFKWNGVPDASLFYWVLTDSTGNSWFNDYIDQQTQVTLSDLPIDGRSFNSELYTIIGNNWDVSVREFVSHASNGVANDIWRPAPGTSWQWQLTGEINTGYNVEMYNVDLFDTPQSVIDTLHAQNRTVICYFSAGSFENWRPDVASFTPAVKGLGNGWAGERWLDIRAIDTLAPIVRARLDLAVAKGCDGVEPDNVDGYINNTGFPLTANDQLIYSRWLADEAHQRGLSVGLKNNLSQVKELEPWFDWALNEQCSEYNECELLLPFIDAGKAVFGVEYAGDPDLFCPQVNALNYDWLVKDLQLGDNYRSCR